MKKNELHATTASKQAKSKQMEWGHELPGLYVQLLAVGQTGVLRPTDEKVNFLRPAIVTCVCIHTNI